MQHLTPTLYVPVAIPGAGKTTWTKQILSYAAWISSDDIRNKEFPGPYDHTKNAEVFERYHLEIHDNLGYGVDVIADATNLEARARRKLYHIAEQTNARVHVLLFTNTEQALVRNRARQAGGIQGTLPVPEDVMLEKMIPRYEQTLAEIDTEPHDFITRIESVG